MTLSQFEAYALTLAVEALVAGGIAPLFKAQPMRMMLAAAAGSALTHPVVWLGAYALYHALGGFAVPLLEVFAIGVEAIFYRALALPGWRAALLASVIANLASWGLGILIQGR